MSLVMMVILLGAIVLYLRMVRRNPEAGVL
jgi:hypothetical protein